MVCPPIFGPVFGVVGVTMPKMSSRSPYGHAWRKLRRLVLEEEDWRCWACGDLAESVDHIVGVQDAPHLVLVRSNLRAACPTHNQGLVSPLMAKKRRVERAQEELRPW